MKHFTFENQSKLLKVSSEAFLSDISHLKTKLLPALVLETAPTAVRVLSSKALVAVAILRAVLYSNLEIKC